MYTHTDEYKTTYYTTNDGHTTFNNSDYKKCFRKYTHRTPVFNWEYWPGEEPDWKPVDHSTDLITVYAPQEYTIPTKSNPDGQKIVFRLYKIHAELGDFYLCETDGPYTCEVTRVSIFEACNCNNLLKRELNYLLRSAYRETWATLKALEGTPVDCNQSPETNPVNLKEVPAII